MKRESIFSFKDYFFYTLKRWFIVVACFVIGVGTGTLIGFLSTSTVTRRYEAEVNIIILDDYRRFLAETRDGWEETEILIHDYTQNAGMALDAMAHRRNFDIFLIPDENVQLIERFGTGLTPRRFLDAHLRIERERVSVSVLFEHNSDFSTELSLEFLNRYAEFLQQEVLARVRIFREIEETEGFAATSRADARLSGDEPEDTGRFSRYAIPMGLGAVAGVLLSMLITLIWYKADPKVKSKEEIERIGFEVLASHTYEDLKNINLVEIMASNIDSKVISIICDKKKTTAIANGLAQSYAKVGARVLLVDVDSNAGESNFKDFFDGKTAGGDDVTRTTTNKDEMFLIEAKKEDFNKLIESYDKVIFSLNNSATEAKFAAAISQFSLCIIERQTAKTKDIIALEGMFSEATMLSSIVIEPTKNK